MAVFRRRSVSTPAQQSELPRLEVELVTPDRKCQACGASLNGYGSNRMFCDPCRKVRHLEQDRAYERRRLERVAA